MIILYYNYTLCTLKDGGDARYHSDSREERFMRGKIAVLKKAKDATTSILQRGMNIFHEREVNEIREQEDDLNSEYSDYSPSESDNESDD